MPVWPDFLSIDDLCPGDLSASKGDWSALNLRLHTMTGWDDPYFKIGYQWLRDEFESRGEVETREVLAMRLRWDPATPVGGAHLLYRMLLLFSGDECVAVRDHTAILLPDSGEVVVHLSHVLVAPAFRGTGLAAVLRALPFQTARECARAAGRPDLPITLAAEMEPFDPDSPASIARGRSYEKAGFLKVEPSIGYRQPDFRSPDRIDASGGPRDVPLDLVILRRGRTGESRLPAADLHTIVRSLYTMYATGIRTTDMQSAEAWFTSLQTAAASDYALMPPTRPV